LSISKIPDENILVCILDIRHARCQTLVLKLVIRKF